MSDQRQRRWTDFVKMLYKCFVFAEKEVTSYLKSNQLLPFVPALQNSVRLGDDVII